MLDKLFRPRPADGMVLVLGLGRFGIACARRLQELGMDVLGVDADLDLVNRYADTLRHVVRMDSTDADALRQLDHFEGVHEGLYRREPIRLLAPFAEQPVDAYLPAKPIRGHPEVGAESIEPRA